MGIVCDAQDSHLLCAVTISILSPHLEVDGHNPLDITEMQRAALC